MFLNVALETVDVRELFYKAIEEKLYRKYIKKRQTDEKGRGRTEEKQEHRIKERKKKLGNREGNG